MVLTLGSMANMRVPGSPGSSRLWDEHDDIETDIVCDGSMTRQNSTAIDMGQEQGLIIGLREARCVELSCCSFLNT